MSLYLQNGFKIMEEYRQKKGILLQEAIAFYIDVKSNFPTFSFIL